MQGQPILGAVQTCSEHNISGWAHSTEHSDPLLIEVTVDGKPLVQGIADKYIQEIYDNGLHPTGYCGYNLTFPESLRSDQGEKEIRVYAGEVRKELDQSPVYIFPDSQKDKIFYLHIPKAAGSSLNSIIKEKFEKKPSLLRQIFGFTKKKPECVIEHIESIPRENYRDLNDTYNFISGHIKLADIRNFFHLQNFLRITVLREPTSHLISHLTWVRNISSDENKNIFDNHNPIIQDISLQLRNLDFTDPDQLSNFVTTMSEHGHRLFNNCQTRYLLPFQPPAKLSEEHAYIGIQHLHFFDIIGTVENYDVFLQELYKKMDWQEKIQIRRENVLSNKFGINTTDDRFLEAVKPLICADQIIYDHVVKETLDR